MRLVLIFTACLGMLSCSQMKGSGEKAIYYFNIDSLVNHQKRILFEQKATIAKSAYVDGDTAQNTYIPDSAGWNNELSFFNKMDINKPVLQGVYKKKITNDQNSNLTITAFTPERENEVEVKYLKLYYYNNLKNLKKVESLFQEKNPIYTSTRNFIMHFDDIEGKLKLTQFEVEGGQKMILKDSVQFKIRADIQYP